jgi:sulfite reductase (NADPH) flavoprotein alpha-component
MMSFAVDTSRLVGAAGLTLAYAALCGWAAWRHRTRVQAETRRRNELQAAPDGAPSWIVAYGSQTGHAEELAWRAAQTLHLAGVSVQVKPLNDVAAANLAEASYLLVIASTYGEGDPPDNAAEFARRMAYNKGDSETNNDPQPDLAKLRYAVLSLGDRTYNHFCGFGRELDRWLWSRAATPLFDRVDVDRMDAPAIGNWFERVAHMVGASDVPEWGAPAFSSWRLKARRELNSGSSGEPVFHVELAPIDEPLPEWDAGDLVQLRPPAAAHLPGAEDSQRTPALPREYSIASMPEDGCMHLLIRLRRDTEGVPGLMSGWMGLQARIGETVEVRVRAHQAFRIGGNSARRLILICNGTGIAGVRAHLKARTRLKDPAPCWLLFGERQAEHDHHYFEDVVAWQRLGILSRVDAVFSRDHAPPAYVQHRLKNMAALVRDWVAGDAAIYVCGSLAGMAEGVDATLREILGDEEVRALARQGRYRRDVY